MNELYVWLQENKAWFQMDSSLEEAIEHREVSASTREFSLKGETEPSSRDLDMADQIIKEAKVCFPKHECLVETKDEWVYLVIKEVSRCA